MADAADEWKMDKPSFADINWSDDEELEQMQRKKRKLEEQEPYNEAESRKRTKQAAMEEAQSSRMPATLRR